MIAIEIAVKLGTLFLPSIHNPLCHKDTPPTKRAAITNTK
jgi:hypothetical protein